MITIAEYIAWRQPMMLWYLDAFPWVPEYRAARARVIMGLRRRALERIMTEPPRPGKAGLLRGEKAF